MLQSDMTDRIVCIQENNGVAAYMLAWTENAEKIYEKNNTAVGLHMEESPAGMDWREQPNLCVQPTWNKGEENTLSKEREYAIIKALEEKADRAKEEYGIFKYTAGDPAPFSIYLVADGVDAQQLYDKLALMDDERCTLHMKAGDDSHMTEIFDANFKSQLFLKLLEAHMLTERTIEFGNMPMNFPDDNVNNYKNKWHISKQIMRRNLTLKHQVERSIAIYDELQSMLDEHNRGIG